MSIQLPRVTHETAFSAGTQIVYVNTWWQNLIVGIKYAFGALTVILVVLYLVSLKKNGKEKE